ncbi:primosomal protein DnaI [Rhodalgimonas zhirmunskyi]|uniref:Primosomal protein DnaI n=1 Tax=Rhodalgimonas zhirmunskyi TaxID=2964767 RepID=A0AAJ1X4F7_9RHOB|nr:primosomal protein DnaI [Rhodoalgimonas zhirmunskyi]MDQ2093456.1 primosomal protein DnaI [Rhodoalgimonas zhirmunskyi]
MAYTSTAHNTASASKAHGGFTQFISAINARLATWKEERRVHAELSVLTARERAEIGLSRNLRAAVKEAMAAR